MVQKEVSGQISSIKHGWKFDNSCNFMQDVAYFDLSIYN